MAKRARLALSILVLEEAQLWCWTSRPTIWIFPRRKCCKRHWRRLMGTILLVSQTGT
ncbi:MAG: hypothetical protein R3C44_21080 [Chloroflexota bacterium]